MGRTAARVRGAGVFPPNLGDQEYLVGRGVGLVVERLRVLVPAGAARKFSSPELTFCADSYSVSIPIPCYRSGT